MPKHEICEHCGANVEGRWERLSPGLVSTLAKFRDAVVRAGREDVSPNKQGWTHSEICNFPKLRYHGLVRKVDGDQVDAGLWAITAQGERFLSGGLSVPVKVYVYRNRVEKQSDEMKTAREIFSDLPFFDRRPDFVYEPRQDLFA